MSEVEHRQQQPRPEALREIRNLLLTPNVAPRYPRLVEDEIVTRRPRRRLMRTRLRSEV